MGVLSFRPQAGRGPAGHLEAVLFLCPDPDFRISVGRKNGFLNNESFTITRRGLLAVPKEVRTSELWLRKVRGRCPKGRWPAGSGSPRRRPGQGLRSPHLPFARIFSGWANVSSETSRRGVHGSTCCVESGIQTGLWVFPFSLLSLPIYEVAVFTLVLELVKMELVWQPVTLGPRLGSPRIRL